MERQNEFGQIRHQLRKVGHANNTEVSYIKHYRQYIQFLRKENGDYVHPSLRIRPDRRPEVFRPMLGKKKLSLF